MERSKSPKLHRKWGVQEQILILCAGGLWQNFRTGKECFFMGGRSLTNRILSYVEAHLEQELTLERLAEELHYSRFYMERVFKANTGMTLCKYIQGRRLDAAARKLAETAQPVVEIAFEAGYGSQQAFTRAFHREYGHTPQEYRKIGIYFSRCGRISLCRGRKSASVFAVPERSRIAA